MVGPGASGKAQGDVVVLDVLTAEGVNRGEMVTKTDVQIKIVAGQDGIARASKLAVVLRPNPCRHQRHDRSHRHRIR